MTTAATAADASAERVRERGTGFLQGDPRSGVERILTKSW
jgi:hypothetical protein